MSLVFYQCEYCCVRIASKFIVEHVKYCETKVSEDHWPCYTCGQTNVPITTSQKNKHDWKARCNMCIMNKKHERYKPYSEDNLEVQSDSTRLYHYIVNEDPDKVKILLDQGVDPNIPRQGMEYIRELHCNLFCWNQDGTFQPSDSDNRINDTPLMSVLYYLEWNTYATKKCEKAACKNYKKIVLHLLQYGASLKDAIDKVHGLNEDEEYYKNELAWFQDPERENKIRYQVNILLLKTFLKTFQKIEEG